MADFNAQFVPADPVYLNADTYALAVAYFPVPTTYAQRVWSTGGGGFWCYYIDAINPSPASSATTPNWVTSAVRHEVLGPV